MVYSLVRQEEAKRLFLGKKKWANFARAAVFIYLRRRRCCCCCWESIEKWSGVVQLFLMWSEGEFTFECIYIEQRVYTHRQQRHSSSRLGPSSISSCMSLDIPAQRVNEEKCSPLTWKTSPFVILYEIIYIFFLFTNWKKNKGEKSTNSCDIEKRINVCVSGQKKTLFCVCGRGGMKT